MKKIIITLLAVALYDASFACEVCKKQQPKVLRGITHGAGPQSNWDYVIVVAIAIVVVVTLFYSVKWLIKPGEHQADHIKHSILTQESV
jgi:hypothetical protein